MASRFSLRAGASVFVVAAALALGSCSGSMGKGGADRNGDGAISLAEFGAELKEMKHPKQGRWKMSFEANPSGDDGYVRFSTETNLCGPANFWDEFDKGLGELAKPENEKKFKEGLEKFAKENNGKFDLERFDVDGENVSLKVSGSGKGKDAPMTGEGGGSLAIEGKVAETLIDLTGEADYNFSFKGTEGGNPFTMEAKTTGKIKIKGERIGECPPPPPPGSRPEFAPAVPSVPMPVPPSPGQ